MKVDLDNKVALVTGSARGIGKAISVALAQNGAHVAINDVDPLGKEVAKEIAAMGRKSIFVKADVGEPEQVERMLKDVVETFGRLDILVNNAGINTIKDRKPIHEYELSDWQRILQINLTGVFLCSRSGAKQMVKQKKGKIINMGSTAGIVPLRLQSAYVAAKAGVLTLTRSMAMELAPHGICVNAIAPGSILTEMDRALFYSEKGAYADKTESLLSHIPLKKPGQPEDVANAALFLASEESNYITGSILVVDGGWTSGYVREW